MNFPPNIEHMTVRCPEYIDPLERFELLRRRYCSSIPYQWLPAEVKIPPRSGCNLDRLMTYTENAHEAVGLHGVATFPRDCNLGNIYGYLGPNPFGDGFATGIPWDGMAILDMKPDDTFAVIIVWDPTKTEETLFQERMVQDAKAFFDSATK